MGTAVYHRMIFEQFVEVFGICVELIYIYETRLKVSAKLVNNIGRRVHHQTLTHKISIILVVESVPPYTWLEDVALSQDLNHSVEELTVF